MLCLERTGATKHTAVVIATEHTAVVVATEHTAVVVAMEHTVVVVVSEHIDVVLDHTVVVVVVVVVGQENNTVVLKRILFVLRTCVDFEPCLFSVCLLSQQRFWRELKLLVDFNSEAYWFDFNLC